MQTYQGKNVASTRAAIQGDPGFDASKDQVVAKFEDGTEKTALRADVKPN